MTVERTAEDVTPIAAELPLAAAQGEAAAVRVRERAEARREQSGYLTRPGGLARAASVERVALRIDRVTRALGREPLPATAAQEPHEAREAVIAAAVERAAPRLDDVVREAVEAAASPLEAA